MIKNLRQHFPKALIGSVLLSMLPTPACLPQNLKSDCVYSTNPKKFIRICKLIRGADQFVDVSQADFAADIGPGLGSFGRLAWSDLDLPANEETTKVYRSISLMKLNYHRLTDAQPATKEGETLVVDIFYLMAAIRNAERPLSDAAIQNILDKLCLRVQRLGYCHVYLIDDCLQLKHPGYRVIREFHHGKQI